MPSNSYISMGAFETMGTDTGRAATGIAYLEDSVRVLEEQYEDAASPMRRAARGLVLAQSLLQVGRHHHQQQDPQEAVRQYERGVGLVEECLAVHEKDSSKASKRAVNYGRFVLSELLCGLGVAFNDSGRQEEALEALKRALELRKETVGKTHPSVAECLNNLGALFYGRGAHQRAVEHYEQALELLTEAAGGRQDGPHCALTLYNIGVCRQGLGQPAQAAASLRSALQLAERSLGLDHPQVGLIKETLAMATGGPPPAGAASTPTSPPDERP